MRRTIAASVAVTMMTVGGGASYALFGRHVSPKTELSSSAMDAPQVATARMISTPIAPPEPDLIAAKLAPTPTVWPDAPKPVVKVKRPDPAGMAAKAEALNPAGPKSLGTKAANAPQAKPKPKKKQTASATTTAPR